MEPPDPIPNSAVKRCIADGSVGFPHVRVGHCQALNIENPDRLFGQGFFYCFANEKDKIIVQHQLSYHASAVTIKALGNSRHIFKTSFRRGGSVDKSKVYSMGCPRNGHLDSEREYKSEWFLNLYALAALEQYEYHTHHLTGA